MKLDGIWYYCAKQIKSDPIDKYPPFLIYKCIISGEGAWTQKWEYLGCKKERERGNLERLPGVSDYDQSTFHECIQTL